MVKARGVYGIRLKCIATELNSVSQATKPLPGLSESA